MINVEIIMNKRGFYGIEILISLWLTLKTIGFNQNGFKFVIDSNVRMNFK